MAVYEQYADRNRVGLGVAVKKYQARRIFELGTNYGSKQSSSVLEIGPGDGYIAALSRAAGLRYSAIEGSEAVANRLGAMGFEVRRSYVPPLPGDLEGDFKCCYLLHVIEHMKSGLEAAQLLSEIRSTLATDGALVIACPDYARWGQHFYDCDYTHSFPLTRRRLEQALRDQGFRVVHHTLYTGPVFGYSGLPLAWIAKLAYSQLFDDVIGRHAPRDVLNRGFLTMLPNLLTVAKRA